MAGLNQSDGTAFMDFTWPDDPMSAAGCLLNWAPDSSGQMIIKALDSYSTILQSQDLNLGTGGASNSDEYCYIRQNDPGTATLRLAGPRWAFLHLHSSPQPRQPPGLDQRSGWLPHSDYRER